MTIRRWLARNGIFLLASPLLVFLMAMLFPPRLTDGVKHLKNVEGNWEGWFTWADQSRSYPVTLSIRPDGTYVFDTALRTTEGVIRIERGRVHLFRQEWIEGPSFSRGLVGDKHVLQGDNGRYGTFHLERAD